MHSHIGPHRSHVGFLKALVLPFLAIVLQAQSKPIGDPPSLSTQPSESRISPAQTSDSSSGSIISPDDLLDIYVLDVAELSRQYRVSPGGTVQLPLLAEPLPAADMTVDKFSELLESRLHNAGLVTSPHVTVSIVSSRLKSVAIAGAVKKPQIYTVFGRTTLLDLLSQAEGLDQDASNLAIITRGEVGIRAQPGERSQTVDLKKLLESGDPGYNVDIYPGDRITVPRAGVVYVVGAVNKPGGFAIRSTGEGLTVLQAIALAEDLKSTAMRDRTLLIRTDASAANGRKQISLDLKKILGGKSEDPVLQAGDILFVPDNQSAKAFRRSIEAAISMTSSIAIYSLRF